MEEKIIRGTEIITKIRAVESDDNAMSGLIHITLKTVGGKNNKEKKLRIQDIFVPFNNCGNSPHDMSVRLEEIFYYGKFDDFSRLYHLGSGAAEKEGCMQEKYGGIPTGYVFIKKENMDFGANDKDYLEYALGNINYVSLLKKFERCDVDSNNLKERIHGYKENREGVLSRRLGRLENPINKKKRVTEIEGYKKELAELDLRACLDIYTKFRNKYMKRFPLFMFEQAVKNGYYLKSYKDSSGNIERIIKIPNVKIIFTPVGGSEYLNQYNTK